MITLENVTLQLGLPVDEAVVTGVVHVEDWRPICHQLLGKVPNKFSGSRIDMKWLEENFSHIDNSSSKVHLRWILQLIDLKEARRLSWGLVILATLYQEMCRATKAPIIKIG
ncbi:hypothetical protein Gotur_032398 [Gossypium turneri]